LEKLARDKHLSTFGHPRITAVKSFIHWPLNDVPVVELHKKESDAEGREEPEK
jgi:hypothetical protein